MKGIYLSELRLRGPNVPDVSIGFKLGVNIVSGPSNTGKTFLFELIKYMLGSGKIDRRIKESKNYDEIYLEICDYNGSTFTLMSDFHSGDFIKFDVPIKEITPDLKGTPLKREHAPGKNNSISSFILSKCNLYGSLIRTNASGKKREISLRDLRLLYLVDELRIPTKESPFLTSQHISKTAEENVLKLIITGNDDSKVIESLSDKVIANKNGRLEALNELIEIQKTNLIDCAPKAEIENQKESLIEYLASLKSERDDLIERIRTFGIEKQKLTTEINLLSIRYDELETLSHNTGIVKKQYISDIQRLKSTIEAESVITDISSIRCPICASNINNTSIDLSSISECASSELNKIKGLLRELSISKEIFTHEMDSIRSHKEIQEKVLASINEQIEFDIKEKLDEITNKIDQAQEVYYGIVLSLTHYDSFEYLLSQKDDVSTLISNATSSKNRTFDHLKTSDLKSISDEMLVLLKRWGYPDIDSVSYDPDIKDFLLSEEARNLSGKGFRAISYSAFLLALIKASEGKNYGFGFCMIDSPLVTYRKPDVPEGEGISEDMTFNFYSSLGEMECKYQVIIIENEKIPLSIEDKVNHIHFTRNKNIGRYGLLPPSNSSF